MPTSLPLNADLSPLSAGLPVNNDDTDSNKSGSSRSDPHHHGGYHSSLLYQHPSHHHHAHVLGPGGKGKQLPKGIYLSTMELLELANDEDSANVRRLDRWVRVRGAVLWDGGDVGRDYYAGREYYVGGDYVGRDY